MCASPLKSILSHRGYSVALSGINQTILDQIKKELTIIPYIENKDYAVKITPIKLYTQTDKRLYMPRHYGTSRFGSPDEDKISNSSVTSINVPTILVPREQQIPVIQKALEDLETIGGGVLCLPCGAGKCTGVDTPIIMYDGTIKKVQDIVIGDQLMGDDSTPRNVLNLARGREMMYKITPIKGDPYIVNESHILSLKVSGNNKIFKYIIKGKQLGWAVQYFDHEDIMIRNKFFQSSDLNESYRKAHNYLTKVKSSNIVDIKLTDYLNLPASYHGRAGCLLGYRVPITFEHKDVDDFDPYLLGHWLGDGTSSAAEFTSQDKEIVEYYREAIKNIDPTLTLVSSKQQEIRYSIKSQTLKNPFRELLRKYNVFKNKHIPHIYKCNSRDVQLKLLAGLIDSDGYLDEQNKTGYEIIQKRKQLAEDITFLCRSLGFAAYMKECKKTCTNAPGGPKTGTYYRVNFSGNGLEQIPVLLDYKKASPRKQIKDPLATRISIERLDVDNYYGFVLDGNHRFMLGDFQVTHNTGISLYIGSVLKVKMLVVSHTTSLMQQWVERIHEFLPTARIGIIQQDKADVKDKDIVIASLKTLAMKQFDKSVFEGFGFTVWDEVHLMCTNLFSNAFPKCATKYSLGLSATPYRKDRCDTIFQYHLGPVLYTIKRPKNNEIIAQCVTMMLPEEEINIKYDYKGDVQYTTSVINVVYNEKRTNRIVEMIIEHARKGRKILVLGEYVKHLKDILKRLIDKETKLHNSIVEEKVHTTRKTLEALTPQHILLPQPIKDTIMEYYRESLGDSCFTYGLYIGEMKNKDRKISEEKDVILGTYKLASVGMDIPKLNTLIMASPRKDIEQSVGRILRKDGQSTEIKPLIIDIIDNHGIFANQSRTRKQFYKQYGYTIEHIRMDPVSGKTTSKRTTQDSTSSPERKSAPKMDLSTTSSKTKPKGGIQTSILSSLTLGKPKNKVYQPESDECLLGDD